MTNIFNIKVPEKQNTKIPLLVMAKEKFDDDRLISEIDLYLKARRQARNYPARVSWQLQLELLEKLPPEERINSVHKSVICGYRSMVYEHNSSSNTLTRNHIDKTTKISDKEF